jgi:hypothetical protein
MLSHEEPVFGELLVGQRCAFIITAVIILGDPSKVLLDYAREHLLGASDSRKEDLEVVRSMMYDSREVAQPCCSNSVLCRWGIGYGKYLVPCQSDELIVGKLQAMNSGLSAKCGKLKFGTLGVRKLGPCFSGIKKP